MFTKRLQSINNWACSSFLLIILISCYPSDKTFDYDGTKIKAY